MVPKIYVRGDLDMPLGKICAQVSHALMSMVTKNLVLHNEHDLLMPSDKYEAIRKWNDDGNDLEIITVDSEQELRDSVVSVPDSMRVDIVDQGRTCFDGEMTWTVTLILPEELAAEENAFKHEDELGEFPAKQAILVKTRPKKKPVIRASYSAIASTMVLFNKIELNEQGDRILNLKEEPGLTAWLFGSFAKVALGSKSDIQIGDIIAQADYEGLEYYSIEDCDGFRVIAFEPALVEKINKATGELRPL